MYYKDRVADPGKVVGLTSPREDRGVVYTGCNYKKNLRIGVEIKLVSMDSEKGTSKDLNQVCLTLVHKHELSVWEVG